MYKLLQINVTANSGSTGKIAEAIGQLAISRGWESWIAYGRGTPQSESHLIRIGNDLDMRWHGVETRLLDNHGLASRRTTRKFISQIKEINPDIIHLHNIHGYFINYPQLFRFLREWGGPVVWTWHDIWPMTGHCAFFGKDQCEKWMTGCHECKRKTVYPGSLLNNRSSKNFEEKRRAFSSLDNMTIVMVSEWLNEMKKDSFLKDIPGVVINNGIDLDVFSPEPTPSKEKEYVLAVANVWTKEKGWDDLMSLRKILSDDIDIIMIGLNDMQMANLPEGIIGLRRTQNINELRSLYSNAIAFINPTWGDNFPTTNIEALACGTPVITYRTGGSPEAIDSNTGIVVEQGDVQGLKKAIETIRTSSDRFTPELCRARAEKYFNQDDRFEEYFELYEKIINKD